MKQYVNYKLEEFLLDDSFREWVDSGADISGTVWEELLKEFPAKKSDFSKAISLIRGWKRPNTALTDEQMNQDIQRILATTYAAKRTRRFEWSGWRGYAAASLLLGFFLAYWLIRQPTRTHREAAQTHSTETEIVIFNSEKEDQPVSLPDGTTVRLSPGSQISYSSEFKRDETRTIRLVGEAFFEVSRDTLRPFLVYAGELTTRVLGTSFTIRSGGSNVSVTVVTGRVEVSRPGQEAEPMVLTPNQKAIYTASEQTLTKMLAEAPLIVAPLELNARFAFDEEPVGNIFKALEKAYGIRIRFDEETLSECFVTLPFREEPFYQKLDVLCRTIKATYKVSEEEVFILSDGCE